MNLQLFNDVQVTAATVAITAATITPAAATIVPAETAPAIQADTKAKIQEDIAKIESHILALVADGEDLFSEEIANLRIKLVNAQAELASLAEDAEAEAQKIKDEVKTWAQQFREKHGISPWVAVIGGALLIANLIKAVF